MGIRIAEIDEVAVTRMRRQHLACMLDGAPLLFRACGADEGDDSVGIRAAQTWWRSLAASMARRQVEVDRPVDAMLVGIDEPVIDAEPLPARSGGSTSLRQRTADTDMP